jgi:phospholipid/cholesterol/gamma-HCH transport system substrate-binding protein/paraquat-inducible protein B
MRERVGYVRLGLFVLIGTGLLVAAVLVLGAGIFSRGGIMIETYIDESVQGLDLGSPIKQRGVKIGTVTEIGFVREFYHIPLDDPRFETVGRYVVVRGRLQPIADRHLTQAEIEATINKTVAAGLRLKLATQGLTGTSYLEADYVDPRKNPPLIPSWTPEYLYIPSSPSTIAQIGDAAQRVFDRLDRLDIEGVVKHLDALLISLDGTVRQANVPALSKNADRLLVELRETSAAVRRVADATDATTLQRNANQALRQLDRTLADTSQLLTSRTQQLDETLESLRASAANLEDATRTLRSYPSLLLLGEPPPRFQPPKRSE